MKNGYRVIDIDTHVNPSLDTLIKYVEPSFRPRLDEFKPYIRTVGSYNALSIASIPFDRFPGEAPSGDDQAAVAGGRGALEGRVTKSSGHHRVDPQHGVSDENAAGRLADMDLEGRDVDVIIPGTWANGLTGIEDVTLAEGLYSAYHRYMREYCSADPERLRSIILAPAADIEWAVSEVKAVSEEKWAVAVAPILPEGMPIDHPALDPLFEVMNDQRLPILHHSFTFEPPYFPGYRDMWGNIAVAAYRRPSVGRGPAAVLPDSGPDFRPLPQPQRRGRRSGPRLAPSLAHPTGRDVQLRLRHHPQDGLQAHRIRSDGPLPLRSRAFRGRGHDEGLH